MSEQPTPPPLDVSVLEKAADVVQMVLGASFMLGEMMVAHNDLVKGKRGMIHGSRLSAVEQYILLMGECSGLEDEEYGGQMFFPYALELLRIREQLGRLTPDQVMVRLEQARDRHLGVIYDNRTPLEAARNDIICCMSFIDGWISGMDGWAPGGDEAR